MCYGYVVIMTSYSHDGFGCEICTFDGGDPICFGVEPRGSEIRNFSRRVDYRRAEPSGEAV